MKKFPYISFNAGPTHVSDKVMNALREVVDARVFSMSHRSKEFSEISEQAIEGLRKQMKIPKDYHIFYQNSSTIAWDTVLQNVVDKQSFHFVCGEFSSRFHQTGEKLRLNARKYETPSGHAVKWEQAPITDKDELVCITHNETRSGLMWPQEVLKQIREKYPQQLIAIDVCSSFGAMKMNWSDADIWLGSVQKGLTMPAGLAYLIVNPRAFERALKLNKSIPSWHKFEVMRDMMKVYQIYETPNAILIALLAKLMEDWNLEEIDAETKRKAQLIYGADLNWVPQVKDPAWQSLTSTIFDVDNAEKWHKLAEAKGYQLGKCFGPCAENAIRICNFPSHTYEMFENLIEALKAESKIKQYTGR